MPDDSPVSWIWFDGDPDAFAVGGIATSGVGATLIGILGSDVAESDEPPSDGGAPESGPPGPNDGCGCPSPEVEWCDPGFVPPEPWFVPSPEPWCIPPPPPPGFVPPPGPGFVPPGLPSPGSDPGCLPGGAELLDAVGVGLGDLLGVGVGVWLGLAMTLIAAGSLGFCLPASVDSAVAVMLIDEPTGAFVGTRRLAAKATSLLTSVLPKSQLVPLAVALEGHATCSFCCAQSGDAARVILTFVYLLVPGCTST